MSCVWECACVCARMRVCVCVCVCACTHTHMCVHNVYTLTHWELCDPFSEEVLVHFCFVSEQTLKLTHA